MFPNDPSLYGATLPQREVPTSSPYFGVSPPQATPWQQFPMAGFPWQNQPVQPLPWQAGNPSGYPRFAQPFVPQAFGYSPFAVMPFAQATFNPFIPPGIHPGIQPGLPTGFHHLPLANWQRYGWM